MGNRNEEKTRAPGLGFGGSGGRKLLAASQPEPPRSAQTLPPSPTCFARDYAGQGRLRRTSRRASREAASLCRAEGGQHPAHEGEPAFAGSSGAASKARLRADASDFANPSRQDYAGQEGFVGHVTEASKERDAEAGADIAPAFAEPPARQARLRRASVQGGDGMTADGGPSGGGNPPTPRRGYGGSRRPSRSARTPACAGHGRQARRPPPGGRRKRSARPSAAHCQARRPAGRGV
jgi:hypothetical protein